MIPKRTIKRMLPQRITWRWVGHLAGERDHRMSYRSDRWGCNCVLITPVLGDHKWGRRRTEYLMDGSDRRWRSWKSFRIALAERHGFSP